MDVFDTILKILGAAAPIFAVLKGLLSLGPFRLPSFSSKNKVRAKEDYEFLEKMIQEPIEMQHPLLVEQGYFAYKGKRMQYRDIEAILKFANPMRGFALFDSAKSIVKLNVRGSYVYRPRFVKPLGRRWKIRIWSSLYFIIALLAGFPTYLLLISTVHHFDTNDVALLRLVAIPVLVFGFLLAFLMLDHAVSIQLAEELMKEQKYKGRSAPVEEIVQSPINVIPLDRTGIP